MKKRTFLITSSLALLLGLGVVGGLSANRTAKAVKADTDISFGNSGTIFLQLNTNEWKSSDSKIGLYMFDNSVSKSAWGDYVTPSGDSRFVEYSYSLDFTPDQCIAFRMDPDAPAMGDWLWENNRGDSRIWSTTNDTTFDNVVWLGNYYHDSKWTESGAYAIDAVVKGGASDDWSVATVDVKLTKVKVNDDDNLEAYGEVTFPANTYFKVVKEGSTWCGSYTANELIEGNLENTVGEGNIHNTESATYEIFFDYDNGASYINDPVLADADEWSQHFLAGGCTTVTTGTKAKWGAHATSFAGYITKHGSAFSNVFVNQTHIDHSVPAEGLTFVARAVQRYDYVLELYGVSNDNTDASGYQDFMGRVAANKVTPKHSVRLNVLGNSFDNNNGLLIIGIISLVTASAVAGYFLLRRKKQK